MGFFYALILGGCSFTLILFIWKSSRRGNLEEKRMLFVALTAFLGLFAIWVFIILFIRLLGFMTSPNPNKLKNKLYPVEEDSMHGIYSYYDNETESIVFNIIYPEYDTFMVDYKIDWKKFKKCSSRGAQTRIQHDHIGDPLKLDFSLLFHVRKFTLNFFKNHFI